MMSTIINRSEPFDRMLTVNEVAELLHVHPATVRRWEKRGDLKARRFGPKGTMRFKREEVVDFINSNGNH